MPGKVLPQGAVAGPGNWAGALGVDFYPDEGTQAGRLEAAAAKAVR